MRIPQADRDEAKIHPALVELAERLNDEIAGCVIIEGLRSPKRHAALMTSGYTQASALRKVQRDGGPDALRLELLKLKSTDFDETRKPVTRTGKTKHFADPKTGLSHAADIAVLEGATGDITWAVSDYVSFVAAGKIISEVEAKFRVRIRNLGQAIGDWVHWQIEEVR